MSVLTLAEVKTHLTITVATFDAKLQVFIDAAEAAVAKKVGPLTSVSTTERVRGGRRGLSVRTTPIVSLTSITPVGGTAYPDLTQFDVDKSAGVIEWTSGACFPTGSYDIVYQAGRSSVPADLLMGIKELVRHMWQPQRGSGQRRPGTGDADESAQTLAHLYVYRVQELILPHVQVGN